jgi:hypothetical protein
MPSKTEGAPYRIAVLEESALRYRTSERVALACTVIASIRRATATRSAARKIQAAVIRAARARLRNDGDPSNPIPCAASERLSARPVHPAA